MARGLQVWLLAHTNNSQAAIAEFSKQLDISN